MGLEPTTSRSFRLPSASELKTRLERALRAGGAARIAALERSTPTDMPTLSV